MILIIGGAYQGKLAFAKESFGIKDEEIYSCCGTEIDFSKKCIYRIEEFSHCCVKQGMEPEAYFKAHREQWMDSILICEDIFSGVVPLEAGNRIWRQETGRLCQYLAREAKQVSRIFCGLEQRLK